MARDLQILFEYAEWVNFAKVIEKAKMARQNFNHLKDNHFRDVTKMVSLRYVTQREIPDFKLSRTDLDSIAI